LTGHGFIPRAAHSSPIARVFGLFALATGLLVAAAVLPLGPWLDATSARVARMGAWGPVVFVLVYVAATVAMVPGSALTLAAGALFGPVEGTVVAVLGANGGAAAAFLVARTLARDLVVRAAARHPRWRALDDAVSRGGWRVVALLRLSPLVPFNVQNYLYGLTGVGFMPCTLASAGAMLPGAVLYASLGAAGRAGLDAASGRPRGPAEWALIAVGLAATAAVSVYLARLARASLPEVVAAPDGAGNSAGARP
jgi:uncharacterized membrane protein YdjX (TVP38/TMEM64 family)